MLILWMWCTSLFPEDAMERAKKEAGEEETEEEKRDEDEESERASEDRAPEAKILPRADAIFGCKVSSVSCSFRMIDSISTSKL